MVLTRWLYTYEDGQDEINDGADGIHHESYGHRTPFEDKMPQVTMII
jgi:hypothetical protein